MIIAFHNPKGGVGTTTLAALFCVLAAELDAGVAGVASPESPDFEPWLRDADIPCLGPEAALADADHELLVLDVPSRATPPIQPDVWVIPIADPRSLARAVEFADTLAGDIVWIGNRRRLTTDDVPERLRARVHVAPSIRSSYSIAAAATERRIPWSDPALSRSSGATVLRDALEALLDHLADPGDRGLAALDEAPADPASAPFAPIDALSPPTLAEPALVEPTTTKPARRRYRNRVIDEYRSDPARDFARLRELYKLPDPDAPRGMRSAHFRLPPDIDAALGELAKAHGCSRTHVVCSLIAAEHRRLQRKRPKTAADSPSRARQGGKRSTGPSLN